MSLEDIKNQPICVTGGSGFLASWIVKLLLDKGFTKVRTTTRRLEKALFLRNLDGASEENLQIFHGCDFSVPHSFDDAIQGCYAVIHCASPFFNAGGTRENLVEPAVAGTEMVLRACREFGVKRVTLTASSACVIVDYGTKAAKDESGNHVYTDADFSPADILEEKKNYYSLSKLYAEQRAWELSKEPGCPFKLCVLNPSLIWGPMIHGQTHLNTSSMAIVQYMDGTHSQIQNGYRCVVDVRDVAEAHIVPIEKDIGWGKRYLLFGAAPHFKETASYIRNALQKKANRDHHHIENDQQQQQQVLLAQRLLANVPTEVEETLQPTIMGPPADKPLLFDNSPATRELGITFRSVEEMVTTCVDELLANGFTGSDQYDTKKL